MIDSRKQNSAEGDQPALKLQQLLSSLSEIPEMVADGDLDLVELAQDEILFEQGDPSDSMYILIAGMLGIRVRHEDGGESVIDKLSPGAVVGEMGMLAGLPRSATVFALNNAGLIRIGKAGFDQMVEQDLEGIRQLAETTTDRWKRLQLAKALRGLFGPMEVEELHALQARLEWIKLSNGEEIFHQGDAADGMYIVVSGRLRVVVDKPGSDEQVLGEVAGGDVVGEFALLAEDSRSATVYAIRESTLVKMTPSEFQRLVQSYPKFMAIMSRLIVERQLRNLRGHQDYRAAFLSLALIPASPGIDLEPFAMALGDVLQGHGRTFVLTRHRFDEHFGMEGASSTTSDDSGYPAVVAWMNEQEVAHDYLVYVADYEWSTWSCHCLSQSDRALVVADASDEPSDPGPVEVANQAMKAPLRMDLVLVHPEETEHPRGTGQWLDRRQVQRHFHLKQDDPCHLQRFARQLTCRAIGLVLSGGGARGYAHVGAYKAIEEVGIPLDHIGGTSIGSLMGALFVLDKPYNELIELARELADNRNIFDYTLPITSLAASKKVTALVRRLFGERRIEDQWIPFFCVSSNLTRGEPVIHRRGLMWEAVRSSLSIPGVFAPMMRDGDVLVDGSPMNNFPVDLMVDEAETEHIIGILVSPLEQRRREYQLDGGISGWRILASRLNPFSRSIRTPSLIGTVLRAMEINSVYQNRHRSPIAEVVIQPDLKGFSGLDFGTFSPIVEKGYVASLKPLSQWMEHQSI